MICVVIPIYKSCEGFPKVLGQLSGSAERIVVTENQITPKMMTEAFKAGAIIASGSSGRGGQLKLGGSWSGQAEWLLFIHADNVLPDNWLELVEQHIKTHPKSAAYFRYKAERKGWTSRYMEFLVSLRCFWWRLPYGDQGLLISKQMYEDIGGYPEQILFEDVAIIDKIKARYGRKGLRPLAGYMRVDMSRYEALGPWKRGSQNFQLLKDYRRGVPVEELYARYGEGHK